MENRYIISIDMGGTKVLASLISSDEGIIGKIKKSTKNNNKKVDYPLLLSNTINELLLDSGLAIQQINAVCLGIPGSVNPITGVIGIAPNLNIKNLNIKEELQKHIDVPVLIENDVNLAALGIMKYDANPEWKNILVVFVGTGIGGGLIFDRKLYRGSNFFAGEIGHLIVDPKGPVCGCGKKGCFEAIASRTAIARDITNDISKGKKSKLSKIVEQKGQIKSKALANAIKDNDKVASGHISKSCETIGRVLANVNNLLNLDAIILGGGVIEALESFMLPKIKDSFYANSLKATAEGVNLLATRLGDDAAIYGGIVLAEEFNKL